MMRKRESIRKMLYGVGVIFFSIGLMLMGFYSDLNLFGHTNKLAGVSAFICGVLCLSVSNFFRAPRNKKG
ncbi:hypothetical protein COI93_11815 [Bacillus cereus]|uniref:Uncharacterized protein n=1 Tax=Bacillus cereus TaxID=1396 RepID=A0A2B0MBQ1_BACCE|nr:hypothetical protein COI93_11815 [Bacillus cereus]